MTLTRPAPTAPAEPSAPTRTGVRPEIQGLRAVAVSFVVLYHLWPARLPGGYVGVDVFFVVSGFLITGHLLRELEATGRVRLGRFWARRARRLLPSSLLVLVAAAAATVVWVPPALWRPFLVDTAGAATYVLNWLLAAQAVDYLAAEDAASPVLHYWSLSVEEQFYLVWPVLLLAAAVAAVRLGRRPRAAAGWVVGAVTVASLAWSLHLTATSPSSAYFVTTTRAWQFGVGALLALVVARHGGSAGSAPRTRALASGVGLLAVIGAAATFDAATPFPGTAALVPTLGAALVVAAGSPPVTWSASRPLGWSPARWLGDVSYATYLWHWPPLVVLPYALGRTPRATDKLVLLVVVVLLAWLTTRYVEDPARRAHGRLATPRATLGATAVAMAVVLGLCGAGIARGDAAVAADAARAASYVADPPRCFGAAALTEPGCPDPRLADVVVPAPAAAVDDTGDHARCWVVRDSADLSSCSFGSTGPGVPHVALVGDSHARALMDAFVALAEEGRLVVDTYVKAGCAWSTAVPRNDDAAVRSCRDWRDQLGARLVADAGRYDAVVTTSYAHERLEVPRGEERAAYASAGLVDAWAPVLARGTPVIAVRDVPWHPSSPNVCLETTGRGDPSRCSEPRRAAFGAPDPQVAAVERSPGAALLDLSDLFCDDARCPAVVGGVTVYRDGHHVTATYARTLADPLAARLLPLLR